MKEAAEIVASFDALCAQDKAAALATVVAVEGSAYRRPGARMLIAEDGRAWGGVSGGCLERDVIRRARGVIASGEPLLCRYETTDDEELNAGVATGCRGTIDLLIEPLTRSAPGPLPWLARAINEREPIVLATIVEARPASIARKGFALAIESGNADPLFPAARDEVLLRTIQEAWLETDRTRTHLERFQLKEGSLCVFYERLAPPPRLVIFGGGPDAAPVVRFARELGWHVTVVVSRPATGARERFAEAQAIAIAGADDPCADAGVDEESIVVIMTHNLSRDIRILQSLPARPRYLGILGPRSRTDKLIAEVGDRPIVSANVYAPIGLDLGAQTPHEIALAIVAEIQAVLRGAAAGFLRDRPGPIHRCDPDEWTVSAATGERDAAFPARIS